jgi:hypothetical protein
MKTYLKRFTLFIATVLVVGCTPYKERMLRDGYPPSYVEGYEAGIKNPYDTSEPFACDSYSECPKKGVLTAKDKSYAQGWKDAHKPLFRMNNSYDWTQDHYIGDDRYDSHNHGHWH